MEITDKNNKQINNNNTNNIKIVVARYNEDTGWLWKYNQYVLIYNKGIPTLNNPYVVNIPNVGREGHTYLHHIITNWENLSDKIFFTQGKISDHKTFPMIDYLFSNNLLTINLNCNKTNCANMWGHVNFFGTIYNNVERSRFTFGEWWDKYVKKPKPSYKNFKWSSGSIFSISKELIYQNERDYYANLLKTLEHCNNPEEGHYIERSWYYIFNCGVLNNN